MKKMILRTTLLMAAVLALPMSAHAVLSGRDINGAAVAGNDVNSVFLYDDVLNVTWLRDANYSQTSGYNADAGRSGSSGCCC
jgi:GH15 family glucan-1,4-alpha-glucosidase